MLRELARMIGRDLARESQARAPQTPDGAKERGL
jgi:hypothetical protein